MRRGMLALLREKMVAVEAAAAAALHLAVWRIGEVR